MVYDGLLNTEGWKDFLPARDFVGRGAEGGVSDVWPDNAKLAVCFVLNYEEGAEMTLWNGDNQSPPFLHEHAYHRQPQVGKRDILVESSFEYGIRCGLPRLLRIFKKYGWQFSTWACGRSFEVTMPYPKILVEDGHEIACHSNHWMYNGSIKGPDHEAEQIRTGIKRLQDTTGRKDVPTAWFGGPASNAHKHMRARIHKEMNVPLLYSSDTYAADLPFYLPSPLVLDGEKDEGLLMIPYSLTNNDHRFMVNGGAGVGAPKDWSDLLIAEFEYLYQEGLDGSPKMMTIAMHNRILGKPARAAALMRFMDHVKSKPDVWVTTRDKMARHWREKFPYETPTRETHQEPDRAWAGETKVC